MPGFPDGSFGWAKVDRHLAGHAMAPKLHVEFVGQGDSDKPSKYPYGTMERADLVEALWESEGIRSTFIVSFDYSSLVTLELLQCFEILRVFESRFRGKGFGPARD